MDQREFGREKFWIKGGEVSEEMGSYLKVTDNNKDDALTPFDAFLSLICC